MSGLTAEQLARLLDEPLAKIEKALENLIKKGLVKKMEPRK